MADRPPLPASSLENPTSDTPVPLSLSSPAPNVSTVHKSRQVSKFEDRYGLVMPFCGEFEFESDPDSYDFREYIRDFCDSGDDEEVEEGVEKLYIPETIPTLIKYINQVRQSFSGSGKSIELVQLDKFVTAGAWSRLLTLSVKEVDAAAAEVVDDDKKTTKIIQAIVDVDHGPDQPLIFEQWRFKPLEGDDACYKPGEENDYDDDEEEW